MLADSMRDGSTLVIALICFLIGFVVTSSRRRR